MAIAIFFLQLNCYWNIRATLPFKVLGKRRHFYRNFPDLLNWLNSEIGETCTVQSPPALVKSRWGALKARGPSIIRVICPPPHHTHTPRCPSKGTAGEHSRECHSGLIIRRAFSPPSNANVPLLPAAARARQRNTQRKDSLWYHILHIKSLVMMLPAMFNVGLSLRSL